LGQTRTVDTSSIRRREDLHGVRFTSPPSPLVSIVIPVHNHVDATVACLQAVHANTDTSNIEVIMVDDASTDGTPALLATVDGLTVVRLERNLGFLEAITAGIEPARGTYVHLLNNDTVVQPGWLEALLEVAEGDEHVGAVGSKLVFPNGRLQEAGSVVWCDGTAWNLGYGLEPDAPAFNVRRAVDYCSAASLLVRRAAFDAVGGFDRRYAPAYYEDTDLCFSLRAAGYPVIYEPASVVVHQGSLSHVKREDTDASVHTKASMDINRYIFGAKWGSELAHHWPSGTAKGFLGGRMERRPRVLVCDHFVPAHDRDSGGLRMSWILRLLADLGCQVTFLPASGLRREPYTREFQKLGIEVFYNPWTFDHLVADRTGVYDLVILSRPSVGESFYSPARRAFPAATVVYDTVDLHYVREQRRLAMTGAEPDDAVTSVRQEELRLIRQCDLVAAVSDDERDEILRRVPDAEVVVLPNVHEVLGDAPGRADRSGMVFIGGFDHIPNVDGMLWFVDEVMPLIQQRWPGKLTILGSNPPEEVCALSSEHVTVTGYQADVDPFFSAAAVFVAPLRYGAGVKGKVGQAMSFGVPVVTTHIGSEGMGIVDGRHALVRDDPAGFAEAVVQLATDTDLWERVSAAGVMLVTERFSPAQMRGRLLQLLARTATRYRLQT
jgi:GT2 family glycosyltransferase/glycosyltransferase involved in cell wall biosynthesis